MDSPLVALMRRGPPERDEGGIYNYAVPVLYPTLLQ